MRKIYISSVINGNIIQEVLCQGAKLKIYSNACTKKPSLK